MYKSINVFMLCIALLMASCTGNTDRATENGSNNETAVDDMAEEATDAGATLPNIEPAQDDTSVIGRIRAEYRRINNAPLTKKEYRYGVAEGMPCVPVSASGTIVKFYEGDELVKIYSEGEEEHGTWKDEYYLKDGKLIFVYETGTSGGVGDPYANKHNNRYYVNDDRIYEVIASPAFDTEEIYFNIYRQRVKRLAAANTAEEVNKVFCTDS